jgi:hypothetical protein
MPAPAGWAAAAVALDAFSGGGVNACAAGRESLLRGANETFGEGVVAAVPSAAGTVPCSGDQSMPVEGGADAGCAATGGAVGMAVSGGALAAAARSAGVANGLTPFRFAGSPAAPQKHL